MKSKIIYIHGIRLSRKDDFAEKMAKEIGNNFEHHFFNWGETVGKDFDQYFDSNYKKPGKFRRKKMLTYKIRRLFWELVGDVLIYFSRKEKIIDSLIKIMEKEEDVILIGHSMGCLILQDALSRYNIKNISKVITLGNPSAMFSVGSEVKIEKFYSWTNFYEKNDIIATKINQISKYHIIDKEFKSSNIFKGHSVFAHVSYWKSNKLIKEIKELINNSWG